MGRLSNEVIEKKKIDGKELYIKGLSVQAISGIIDISTSTVNKWKRDGNWIEAKKLNNLSISELKNEILTTFQALKKGETPNITADQLSKIVSAFEKISDKKKNLAYMYESFKTLSSQLAENVTISKAKEKDFRLKAYQYARKTMDALTEELYTETLNE